MSSKKLSTVFAGLAMLTLFLLLGTVGAAEVDDITLRSFIARASIEIAVFAIFVGLSEKLGSEV